MKMSVILKFGFLLCFLLLLTGIPSGFYMPDINFFSAEIVSHFAFYHYISISIAGGVCFYLLSKHCAAKFFLHGLAVLLLVMLTSLVIDTFLLGQIYLIVWGLDFTLLFLTLVITFLLKRMRKERDFD
ncbi:MAG: hypothetical protein WEA82_05485 [Idiomarina sp.]